MFLSIYLSIYGYTALFWNLAAFHFLNLIHSRYDSLDGGSVRCEVATYTQNKRIQTSMPRVGFEPTIPASERAKTVHALDP
jgi:hypothetical protein